MLTDRTTQQPVEPVSVPVQQVRHVDYVPMRPILEELDYSTNVVPYTQYN